jgi:hypothetical protein
MTGKIEVMFEVMCAECQQAEHPPAQTKKAAAAVLISWDWKKTKRGWMCPKCLGQSK